MTQSPRTDTESAEQFVDELLSWFETVGATRYDEAVTQVEHALQCAALAQAEDGDPARIAGALLHDVGHLLTMKHHDTGEYRRRDLRHEQGGASWLARRFPADVTEPVRLHVAAKRYLCQVDPDYWHDLSAGSKRSLALQGGPMTQDEATEFAAREGAQAAVAIRRWDDRAKVVGLAVPPLAAYRCTLIELAAVS